MDTNNFLSLAPVHGRQAHLAFDYLGTPTAKPNEPSQTLRRKASVTDLKTKAFNDGIGYKFIQLTPDPPESVAAEHNTTTAESGCEDGVPLGGGDSDSEPVTHDDENVRPTGTEDNDITRVENSVDWVDWGFQIPPRQFANTASVSTQGGYAQEEASALPGIVENVPAVEHS